MVFTPSGIVLTLPMFELYEGPLVNLVGVTVAFYPSLEPIVTVICIKDFRKLEFRKRNEVDRVFQLRNSGGIT
ncbi:hypothetical protein CRE_20930 [Caenorhabditis remanei]|uniref:Uncharacterized protein n=1 Tax=Caenorhabditis remanei TaxID=31234 RepID=E3N934_CAERE|nr:hypothetical protein CRE_20930 [Caenorhabditis remanei]